MLTWTTTNATSCTASGGWSGTQPTSGSASTGALTAATTFTLACSSGAGGSANASTTVTITNQAPTANAGPDQTVNSGALVTLNGGASSDPDGSIASYAWSQTAGPAVTLSSTSVAATHLSTERDALVADLQRRAYFGIGAAMSLGLDATDAPFQVRDETIPGAALYRTAGRGITAPEPGRTEVPHWITNVEEARAAVQAEAARKVDIIKVWVDDRNGMYEKLTPELYGAAIDEAHRNGLRATAHIFNLSDAKGLLRAGIDAFAHGIRDVDADDEVVALFKERPQVVVVPNLADRGVATDLSWLRGSIPEQQLATLQAAAVDRPEAQAAYAIQARNLARLSAEGVRIALGTDGNVPWGPHLEMADMVTAGMTPAQVIVAATRNSAELMQLADAGTVAAGKSADFIVLEGNPLDDITNTRRINAVYLDGAVVDREAVRARWASSAQ